jgi:hypothetical protein
MPGPELTPDNYEEAKGLLKATDLAEDTRARLSAAVTAYERSSGAAAPGGEAPFDVPGNLGVTTGPVPKVPARAAPAAAAPAAPTAGGVMPLTDSEIALAIAKGDRAPEFKTARAAMPPGLGTSILRGAGKGLSLSFGDEMAGAGAALADAMTGEPSKGDPHGDAVRGAPFESERSRYAAEDAAAQKANPKAFGAAQIGGAGLATLPLSAFAGAMGLGGAGASLGARVGLGAAEGGLVGGVEGAGSAEPGERLAGAGKGAAIGGAVGAALPAFMGIPVVRRALDKVEGGLERFASQKRGETVMTTEGAINRAKDAKLSATGVGSDALEKLGREVEAAGATEAGILPRSHRGLEEWGETELRNAGQDIAAFDNGTKAMGLHVDLSPVRVDAAKEVARLRGMDFPEATALANKLDAKVESMLLNPSRPFTDAHELRTFIDDLAFDASGAKNGVDAAALRKIAGGVRDAMLESADASGIKGARQVLTDINKRYEVASTVRKNAAGTTSKEAAAPLVGSNAMEAVPVVRTGIRMVNARGKSIQSRVAREAEKTLAAFPDYAPAAGGAMGSASEAGDEWYDKVTGKWRPVAAEGR